MLMWICVLIAGLLGGWLTFDALMADSAPKQGAGAALAVAVAVIPYCMARAVRFLKMDARKPPNAP